ncbi:hypothetical protein SAY86_020683 [Trapa natans]|uniref:Uncharacterized protein n=1 Tax=Trapa natans TaxID=22666 RepID=A0AAN7R1Z9_TRANT|nr:hypothetical protein SAY86_020683 [Trapa natans]
MPMLRKKLSLKKLARKLKSGGSDGGIHVRQKLLREEEEKDEPQAAAIRPGFVAVYVGEERRRFVVPTGSLSHPLFRMILEKAHEEFGFSQRSGLVVPCSVVAFQEAMNAVECCNGSWRFEFGNLVDEFI